MEDFKSNPRDYYQRVEPPRKPKKPSIFPYFIVGIVGILLGWFLFAALLMGGELLAPTENGEDDPGEGTAHEEQQIEGRLVPDEPLEHQHTEVVEAVENVTPAVVGISNYVSAVRRGQEMQIEQGSGSGAILNSDGKVVTNQHVIAGADRIDVIFSDGSHAEASVVGEDELTDLAVLQVDETDMMEDIAPIQFGDSEMLRPGEVAIAIGNPLGIMFQHTVTQGVVSATERQVPIPGSDYSYTFVQTDAAINEGNSGGPLINLAGEVIGINSAKIHDARIEGIGFAIPGNTVERVIDDILEHGRVIRPFMGVLIQDLSDVTGAVTDRGVYVRDVNPQSPAHEANLQEGDVIVGIEEQRIDFTAQLFDRLLDYQPGQEIVLEFFRDGERKQTTLTLGEMMDGAQ